jgi:c-di-GMP-binding flagellar brake protein YcgR
MGPEIEDKRKHKRTYLTAHVSLAIGESEPPLVRHATIGDISRGGVGLYLTSPLEVGTKVKLEIRFLVIGGLKTETIKGKTIYLKHMEDTYYVGVEFDQELNPLQHPELFTHIENVLNWS